MWNSTCEQSLKQQPRFPTSFRSVLPMRVLVVEYEMKAASFVCKTLQAEGFSVDVCRSILSAPLARRFDCILLHVLQPSRDGLSMLQELRSTHHSAPILLLSSSDEANERVAGLNAGADDILSKPFDLEELVARVRALMRRNGEIKAAVLQVADLLLDTITHQVQRSGKSIELTAQEYRLLEFLMRSPGRVFGRRTILEQVWDCDSDPGTNIVDVYIRRLRAKIDVGFEAKLLRTLRRAGYLLKEGA